MLQYEIEMNLCEDYSEMVQRWMKDYGVQPDKNGENISLHLSKDATSPSKFDELLYDWGIYHFHLGETIDHQTGRIKEPVKVFL